MLRRVVQLGSRMIRAFLWEWQGIVVNLSNHAEVGHYCMSKRYFS